MRIDQVFFCGDSQEEIFLLCRDYARVRKNKEIDFFSRARLEEVIPKMDENKNAILILNFSNKNQDQYPLLPLLIERAVKKINPKNIVLGIAKGEEPKYTFSCHATVFLSNIFLNIGLENVATLEKLGFEPDIILLTMFFSKNIHSMSRDRMIQFFEEPDWAEVEIFIKKYNKKRA